MFTSLSLQAQEPTTEKEEPSDSLLIDATWAQVPCSDSTESLYIFQSGRAIYARANSGVSFTLGGTTLKELTEVIDAMSSVTDTATLDSCTTIGVILAGPRYLLLNSSRPTESTLPLCNELATLRKYARRRLAREIEKTLKYIEERPNTGVKTDPALDPETLNRSLYNSPIASTWRCRGTVTVTTQVSTQGNVRRAFVNDAEVEGKCASLLVMTALRAVTLSSFEPAVKIEGKAGSAWMNIVVSFGRKSVTSMEQSMSDLQETDPLEAEGSLPETESVE